LGVVFTLSSLTEKYCIWLVALFAVFSLPATAAFLLAVFAALYFTANNITIIEQKAFI
jgi:hypothetical protein